MNGAYRYDDQGMPFYSRRKIMLYGHTHRSSDYLLEEMLKDKLSAEDYPLSAYSVGAMFQNYTPRRIGEIVKREKPGR